MSQCVPRGSVGHAMEATGSAAVAGATDAPMVLVAVGRVGRGLVTAATAALTTVSEAALEAARSRLRPILMTAFAFILGVIPLVIATGSGAISRQVLGTVVMGGMLAATCISIFIVPSTFSIVENLAHRFGSKEEDQIPSEDASS